LTAHGGAINIQSVLITKYFVHVHHWKTGGSFIKGVCLSHMPADWIVSNDDSHPPASKIPTEFKDLPALGFVRNPWDWYVSWYHYAIREPPTGQTPESPWAVLFDEGRASFRQMITAACTGIPANGGSPPWYMDRIREQGIDHYTHSFESMFRAGFDGAVEIGRFENIREDFIAFLRRHAIPVGEDLIVAVRTTLPVNVTPRDPYTTYYDRELRDLVGSRNRLIAEYGYTFR
jgi:hypothetical protein